MSIVSGNADQSAIWRKILELNKQRVSRSAVKLIDERGGVQFKLITTKIDAYAGQNVQADR